MKSSTVMTIFGCVIAAILAAIGIELVTRQGRIENKREFVVENLTDQIEQFIAEGHEPTEYFTFTVHKSELPIAGEDPEIGEPEYDEEITVYGMGLLEIPKINARLMISEGLGNTALRYGVGHYSESARPGQAGNCAILGHHMKAYGSIFNRLEEVSAGDKIYITDTAGNKYTYVVYDTEVMWADDMVERLSIDRSDSAMLTLVTCCYTSEGKKRFVVSAYIL